jgi:hypothetical protein
LLVIHRHPENGTYRRVEQLAERETVIINAKALLISAVLGNER